MTMKTISFLEGENKIKIGHEVLVNGHDTEQWVSLGDHNIEVTQSDNTISYSVYKQDEYNYDTQHLIFTIQQKEKAQ